MKSSLLFLFSMLITFCLAEATIRYARPWIPLDITGSPTVSSGDGYWLNPNSGVSRHQMGKIAVQYHFYPPHLRDTPIHSHTKSILVLGDSYTFGWLLPANETYIHHLQTNADKIFGKDQYQFLNAAVGGWGTADCLAYLEKYGAEISPKFVLIFLNSDDIGTSIWRNIYTFTDAHSLQLTDNFHPLPHEQLKQLLFNNWLFEHSLLLHFIRYESSRFYDWIKSGKKHSLQANEHAMPTNTNVIFEDAFAIRYGEALFHRINLWCKQHHATLLVTTTGFNNRYAPNIHDPTKIFFSEAPAFFAKEGIPYHDIAKPFMKAVEKKSFQIPHDGHPNQLGAKVIAEQTWPWLQQQLHSGVG